MTYQFTFGVSMKKFLLLSFLVFLYYANSEEIKKELRMPSLNELAPSFTAQSTEGTINFPNDFFDKWVIIFSHPADFTPVCTSEIWELSHMQEDFEKLNTKIMVISTDGLNAHMEWIKSIESMEYKDRKPAKVKFPLISDVNMTISKIYGMQHPYTNTTQNVRGVFIISPDDHIQYIAFYPSNIGRNMDEIKRVLVALQESHEKNVLTPVNWKKGDDYLLYAPLTRESAEKLKAQNDPNLYSYAWYMWFKKNK